MTPTPPILPPTPLPPTTAKASLLRSFVSRYVSQYFALFVGIGLMLFARASFADHYVVPSGSMLPTVSIGDHVLVDKLAYGLRVPMTNIYVIERDQPQIGDVVVLDSPVDARVLLKRVVATPGSQVEVRHGRLVVNGQDMPVADNGGELDERLNGKHHGVRLTAGGGRDLEPTVLPAHQYLVMGDNRGESFDGRYFGLVERGAILGRGEGIFWHEGRPTWRIL